ncbi:hypothetical protein BJX70DRAFT_362702 [Aspergillus crustosus]
MVHAHGHHDHRAHLQERDPDGLTVYVTAAPTFDGPVDGYSTAGQDDDEPATTKTADDVGVGAPVRPTRSSTEDEPATTHTRTQSSDEDEDEDESTTTERPTRTTTKTVEPTEDVTTTTSHRTIEHSTSTRTTLSTITSSATESDDISTSTLIPDQSTATPSNSAISGNESSGLSGGAKAGVAIGVILAVGVVAGLIFFFWKKKKNQQQGQEIEESGGSNEKAYGNYSPPQPQAPAPNPQPMTQNNAPQLNVRPVTQFAPDLTPIQGGITPVSMVSAGAAIGTAAAVSRNLTGNSPPQTPQMHTPQSSVSNRDPFGDPVNPFDNQAEVSSPVSAATRPSTAGNQAEIPSPVSAISSPISAPQPAGPSTISNPAGADTGSSAVAATAAGVAVGAAAAAAISQTEKDVPSRPGSADSDASSIPAPTAPNSNLVDPAVAAGAGSPSGPGNAADLTNVHRVQLDFAPSMEDELELRAGSLVRLLHEYDDGWALCVRLDRSQQGVVPRSCLSARPVKPRGRPPGPGPAPGGPAPGPGPRGPSRPPGPQGPQGPPGSPMTGPPGRMPPPQRFYPQDDGRPGSPSRSMSPGPGAYGPPPPRAQQQRPMSPAQFPQVPRSFSPGPRPRQPPSRSQSPGPYGPPGSQRPIMPAANQRQRSNSTGGAIGQNPRASPGPVSSPLAGPTPPPSSALPAIPTNPAPAPYPDA